jgi:hypothetical protein
MLIEVKLNDGTQMQILASEVADVINSYERRLRNKERIILEYEKQMADQINHILELGKEIDELTDYVFDSPLMHKREKKV